jgi:hypothetical protein
MLFRGCQGWEAMKLQVEPIKSDGDDAASDTGGRGSPIGKKTGSAHPVFAPLAWIVCFLAGVAFWVALFEYLFLK